MPDKDIIGDVTNLNLILAAPRGGSPDYHACHRMTAARLGL